MTFKNDHFLPTSLIHIYNYFVLHKSVYMGNEFEAYKSLESYQYFIFGWIQKIESAEINDNIVVRRKVESTYHFWIPFSHSQVYFFDRY